MDHGLLRVSCLAQVVLAGRVADGHVALIQYAVRLVSATREPEKHGIEGMASYITYGNSPRASINLIVTARSLAYLRGRSYVIPGDVTDMALDVMRHRLVLSYEAMSDGVTADMILQKIMEKVVAPPQPMQANACDSK